MQCYHCSLIKSMNHLTEELHWDKCSICSHFPPSAYHCISCDPPQLTIPYLVILEDSENVDM